MNQNEKARREAIERAYGGKQAQQPPSTPKPAPEPPKRATRPRQRSTK